MQPVNIFAAPFFIYKFNEIYNKNTERVLYFLSYFS